jgi:hypothetical protein
MFEKWCLDEVSLQLAQNKIVLLPRLEDANAISR